MLPASRSVSVCMLLSVEINQAINKMITYKRAIKCVAIRMKYKPLRGRTMSIENYLLNEEVNEQINECMSE